MRKLPIIACILLTATCTAAVFPQQVRKETIELQGNKRTYYLLVPESIQAKNPAPLLLLLHGSGRNGQSIIDRWKDLGVKEGVIIVAPDSLHSESWNTPKDGPDFLHDLLSEISAKYPVDSRRIYLFGHSGGAVFALYMALFESEYFAAVAVHAGALRPGDGAIVERAPRKIPFYITVGTVDPFFPLTAVRGTRDLLTRNAFDVNLIEIKGHDHNYYGIADQVNASAWIFLKQQRLAEEPRYTQYSFK